MRPSDYSATYIAPSHRSLFIENYGFADRQFLCINGILFVSATPVVRAMV